LSFLKNKYPSFHFLINLMWSQTMPQHIETVVWVLGHVWVLSFWIENFGPSKSSFSPSNTCSNSQQITSFSSLQYGASIAMLENIKKQTWVFINFWSSTLSFFKVTLNQMNWVSIRFHLIQYSQCLASSIHCFFTLKVMF